MLSKDYLQICCDIHIHHNLETVKAWALCPMALRSSFWVCFFPHFEFKSQFRSGSCSPRTWNPHTQVPGSDLWEPGITRVLVYSLLRYPRHKDELDSFSVYTTHQQWVHSSSTGFCCSEWSKWKQRISAETENLRQINTCAEVYKPSTNTNDKASWARVLGSLLLL